MKRFLAAVLAALMLCGLTACGGAGETKEPKSPNEPKEPETTKTEAAGTAAPAGTEAAAAKLDKTKTYTVACSADFPPYEYYDGDTIVGVEVDIMDAVAKKLGIQVQYEDMDFDSIIPAIESGKFDIGMSGFTVTDERKLVVDFTDSYTTSCQAVIVPEGSPITVADDLFDNVGTYKIGVQLATTGDLYASDDFGAENVEEYTKAPDAVLALTSGKIDCVIIDEAVAKAFARANEGLKVLDTAYVVEDYAMALNKDSADLLDAMNAALAELMADGTVQDIISQYIQEDGDGAGASEEEAPAAEAQEFALAEDGYLTLATSADFPPYEFYDGGDVVGIDAEIAQAVAGELGLELKIEDMDFDSVIPAVQSGKADIGMAGLTVSEERKLSVDFSNSYATGTQVIIVPEGSPITAADDLVNNVGAYLIGVQLATTGDLYATEDFGPENVEKYAKGADAVLALTSGKIDCVIIDNEPAKAFVEANAGLTILPTNYTSEDYAIATNKDNSALTEQIDQILQELIADGTVQQILDKYIPA